MTSAAASVADLAGDRLRRPRSRTRTETIETLVLFCLATACFFGLGYWLLTVTEVVSFESLDLLNRATMVWWGAPPKLAAIGFESPPLNPLAYLPLALIGPLTSSLVAVPLFSSLCAAATMAVLGRALMRCGMSATLRWPLLLAFACGPMWLFYASNGTADMLYLACLASALYCFVAWFQDGATAYLVGIGGAMALGSLSRYGLIGLALVLTVVIAAAIGRRRGGKAEVEGTVVAYAAPVVYAVALWTFLNGLILGAPLQWLADPSTLPAANAVASTATPGTFAAIASDAVQVILTTAPLALPALIAAIVLRRDDLTLWLAAILLLTALLVPAPALLSGDVSDVTLRSGLPVALVAFVAAGVAWRAAGPAQSAVYVGTIAALLLAIPLSWGAMESYPYQNQEQAFTRALKTGRNLAGEHSVGGYTVGLSNERAMANAIDRRVPDADHVVLTDEAQTYAAMVLSGRPASFLARASLGSGRWQAMLEDPYGRVPFLLIDLQAPGDLVRQRYPRAAIGGEPGLRPVFVTPRYALVEVARRDPHPVGPR